MEQATEMKLFVTCNRPYVLGLPKVSLSLKIRNNTLREGSQMSYTRKGDKDQFVTKSLGNRSTNPQID